MSKTDQINSIIRQALKEDAVHDDITTNSLIPKNHISIADIIIKEEAVICGLSIIKSVFQLLDKNIQFKTTFKDGDILKKSTKIITLKGKTHALLKGERVALNFLAHLCGIATKTQNFVKQIHSRKTKILDTRKTIPGLRSLQKYAVKCGGGVNHRFDLKEMLLIKDNHIMATNKKMSLAEIIRHCRKKTKKKIEVEVDNLIQFKDALSASPEMILLDNMSTQQIQRAVDITKKIPVKKRPLLEASGGITLQRIRSISKTNIDRISVGSLTHTVRSINVGMDFHDDE